MTSRGWNTADHSDWGCDICGRDAAKRDVTRRGFMKGGALALIGTSTIPAFLSRSVLAEVTTAAANGDVVHLHVYRQHRGINSTFAPSIFVDDKQIARVSNGSRFTIKLSPGAHSIRSDDNSSAISLDAKPGQEYFIRVDEVMGMPKSHGKLTMMSPEQGGPEYKLQKPLEDKHKIARDMIEGDGPDES